MLPLRWSLQAKKILFYLERRSLFPLCCFRFSFSPQWVRLPTTRACLAHFPLESSFKIKVSGREGRPKGPHPAPHRPRPYATDHYHSNNPTSESDTSAPTDDRMSLLICICVRSPLTILKPGS